MSDLYSACVAFIISQSKMEGVNTTITPDPMVWTVLSHGQHTAIGAYLVTSGVISGLINMLGLALFVRFPNILLATPSCIPEISLLLGDLCIAGLHPFSGTSAFANRWVWGPYGCQLYSFFGFMFGNYLLLAIPFVAFDRFATCCKSVWSVHRTFKTYIKVFLFLWLTAVFFAAVPLIGWGSYAVTPVGISCTIDWRRSDTSYSTYMTIYTLINYIFPVLVAAYLYQRIHSTLCARPSKTVHWSSSKSTGIVMLGCLLTTPLAFSIYALVCIWPLVGDPRNIPTAVNCMPPLMGKLGGVLNPVFYLFANPRHIACLKKMIGCQLTEADNELMELHEDEFEKEPPPSTSRSDFKLKDKTNADGEQPLVPYM